MAQNLFRRSATANPSTAKSGFQSITSHQAPRRVGRLFIVLAPHGRVPPTGSPPQLRTRDAVFSYGHFLSPYRFSNLVDQIWAYIFYGSWICRCGCFLVARLVCFCSERKFQSAAWRFG